MRILASFIFHKVLGWKIEGAFPKDLKKCIIIVAPHTSWHDFYIGALVRKTINLNINFIAKRELFKFPFGCYFRWMGGAPVDRKAKRNTVQQVIDLFNSRDEFRLALAPEGTRKKVENWRSGFYYMAHNAQVPIVCVAFDYKTKTVKIGFPFNTSGNYEEDYPLLKSFYKNVVGKISAYT